MTGTVTVTYSTRPTDTGAAPMVLSAEVWADPSARGEYLVALLKNGHMLIDGIRPALVRVTLADCGVPRRIRNAVADKISRVWITDYLAAVAS